MQHTWVLDQLADLRRFAREAGLSGLDAALGEAAQVAVFELSNLEGNTAAAQSPPVRREARRLP